MIRSALHTLPDMHFYNCVETLNRNEMDMVTISVPGRLNQEIYELLQDIHVGDLVGSFNLLDVINRKEPESRQPSSKDLEIHRCSQITETVTENVFSGAMID